MNGNILSAIIERLQSSSGYLIAVSGGPDSIALLHACNALKGDLQLRLAVAHINHNLRQESAQDAEFVKKICADIELPFYLAELDSTGRVNNIESWARKERYRCLQQIRAELNLDYILTAHTANDVIETMLMRLVSNKEPRGIMGIDQQRKLVRPFLHVYRQEIIDYVECNKLSVITDSSNLDNKFLRNRIRNKILPVLQCEFGESILPVLLKRSEALAEDQEFLDQHAQNYAKQLMRNEFANRDWLRAAVLLLKSLPESIAWRVVKQAFEQKLNFTLGRINSKQLLEFILSSAVGIQIAGKWEIRRKDGGLRVIKFEDQI